MAYQAQLLNRLVQFGRVSAELLVTDDAHLLPSFRHAVAWLIENDAAASAAILAAAAANATNALRDAEIALNLIRALNQDSVTFVYSTPSENIAAVRALFANLSGWQAVCLANYIFNLGLTNAQYTNFFGYSGAALTTFKTRLASAAATYAAAVATQGG